MRCEKCQGERWVDAGASFFCVAPGGSKERMTKLKPCPDCNSTGSISYRDGLHKARPGLEELLAKAAAEEIAEQRVSFVYGMLPYNSPLTKEQVRRHLHEQAGMAMHDFSPLKLLRRAGFGGWVL